MKIDFTRFITPQTALLPIVDGWTVYNGRKMYFNKNGQVTVDGWYIVDIGNEYKILPAKPTVLQVKLWGQAQRKKYLGFTLGTEVIPLNFDNFFKKGLGETIPVHFLNTRPFEIVEFFEYEDKRFYFYDLANPRNIMWKIIREVKKAFDDDLAISQIKGITPEINYYIILVSLYKQSFNQIKKIEKMKLTQKEKEKRIKDFQSTFAGRLQNIIESTNAKLVKFFKYRNGYMVWWKTALNEQLVKTYINDQMQVISGGFCLSNSDKDHTIDSLSMLATIFEEKMPLYITRE